MDQSEWLAARFEENRTHLKAVAYRMLGSATEAEDAVQDAWLRLSRSDTSEVANLGGWLTTVVARVCLDMLRTRISRREEPQDARPVEPVDHRDGIDPEAEAVLADSIGVALLVVLQTMAPAERVAFVLHDMFDLPFDEIAPIVGRSPAATRQLASRARRRVNGDASALETDLRRKREVITAFLAASRGGDLGALIAVLDPDVVLRADPTAVSLGVAEEIRGAAAVADNFSGRARGAQEALVDGLPGAAWVQDGRPRVVFDFIISDGKIVEIYLLADPEVLGLLGLTMLGA